MNMTSDNACGAVLLVYGCDEDLVSRALRMLEEGGISSNRVVIVNNPRRQELLPETFNQRCCRILRLPRNIGYAGGMNLGLGFLRAQGLQLGLLMTQDVAFDSATVSIMVHRLTTTPEAAMVGPLLLFPTSGSIFSCGGFLCIDGSVGHGHAPTPKEHLVWADGSLLLVRLHALEQVNDFDSTFFMYWEEVDLARKLNNIGWRVVIADAATATQEPGLASRSPAGDFLMTRNGLECRWRYGGVPALLRGLSDHFAYAARSVVREWRHRDGRIPHFDIAVGTAAGAICFAARCFGPPPRALATRSGIESTGRAEHFRRIRFRRTPADLEC